MTVQEQDVRRPNSEVPGSFLTWDDYARNDTRPVSSYLFERGDVPVDDFTIDTAHFTSAAFHELEVEHIWTKMWQLACRANDIPDVGS